MGKDNKSTHSETGHFSLRNEIRPGDLGTITFLHGKLYAEEHGFDHTFEPYVAGPLSEFVMKPNDRSRIWIAETDQQLIGSIAIVEVTQAEAQLRWLLVHPDARGFGLGKTLVSKAIRFSREQGYASVFLWTLNILTPATRLYRSFGFQKTEEAVHDIWGRRLTEQRYDLSLTA